MKKSCSAINVPEYRALRSEPGGSKIHFLTLLRIQGACWWRSASFRCRLPISLNDVFLIGCRVTDFLYGDTRSCVSLWCGLKGTAHACCFCKEMVRILKNNVYVSWTPSHSINSTGDQEISCWYRTWPFKVYTAECHWTPSWQNPDHTITTYFIKICLNNILWYKYTECFTTLGHNCRRWFPRSLWSKKFI